MKWSEILDNFTQGNIPKPKHAKALNIPQIKGWEKGKIWTELDIEAQYINPQGALFGGYITAIADELLGIAVLSVLDDDEVIVTASSSMNFFRPIRAEKIFIEAKVLNRGRTSAVSEIYFYKEDKKLAAKGSASQSIIKKT